MVFREEAVVEHVHSTSLKAYLRKKSTIGYWKAHVVRLHPERLAKDSHTPQVMKLQMALAMLWVLAIAGGLVALVTGRDVHVQLATLPALGISLLFLVTTLPFARKVWPKDRQVALLSPLLLFGRALALNAGYIMGLLKPANLGERSRPGMTGNDGTNFSR
jgi:hypothetical protein